MHPSSDPAEQQCRSWSANADAWTQAVRTRQIESRRVATDAAVLEAILAYAPSRVLDLGCGEGWLCRALADHGIETVGVDASERLIETARTAGGARYHVLPFRSMAAEPERIGNDFDVVVFNFSLLDDDIVPLLSAALSLLTSEGVLMIQTVHPWSARGEEPYRSGWRTESFAGFGSSFSEPMPWYFRTVSGWIGTLRQAGLQLSDLQEPLHPETERPLSLLLVCQAIRRRSS